MPFLSEQREGKISQLSGHPHKHRKRTEAVQTLFLQLLESTAMPLVDSREELSDAQNFFCVNGNVRGLSGCTPGWFCITTTLGPTSVKAAIGTLDSRCIMMLAFGRQCLFPFSPGRKIACISPIARSVCRKYEPAAKRRDPMDAAWPTQYVCIGDETY